MVYQKWWYVVIVGTVPGVYSSWIEAGPKTKNIPGGAIHQKFPTEAEAIRVFEAARARGEVRAHPELAIKEESTENLSPLGEVSLLNPPLHLNRVVESTGLQTPRSSPARSRVAKLRRALGDSTDSCSTSSSPPTNVTQYLPLYMDDDTTPPTSPVQSSHHHFTFTSSSSRAYPDVPVRKRSAEEMRVPLEVSDWGSPSSIDSSADSRPSSEEHTSKSPGCMPFPEPPQRSVGVAYQGLPDLANMQHADSRIWLPISRVFDPDRIKPRPLTRPPSPIKGSASPASSYHTPRTNPPSEYQSSPMNSPFVRANRGRCSRLTPSLSLPVLPDWDSGDGRPNCGPARTQLPESPHTGKARAKETDCSDHDTHLVERSIGDRSSPSRSHVQLVPRDGRDERSVITVHCPPGCLHETCYGRSSPPSTPVQTPRPTGPRYVDACVSPIITIPSSLQKSPTKIRAKTPDLDRDRPFAFAGFTHVSYKGVAPESDVRSPIVKGTMVPTSVAEPCSLVHGRMRRQKASRAGVCHVGDGTF